MNASRPIALVGLPGVGKSVVGKRLARQLGREFVDADHAIEERLGCAISLFFEIEGESRFRDIEAEVLARVLVEDTVIATGGGVVVRDANRALLKARSIAVYLRAQPAALVGRLQHDSKRPLLRGPDLPGRLALLHAERDPLYEGVASFIIDTAGATLGGLVATIVAQLASARPAEGAAS